MPRPPLSGVPALSAGARIALVAPAGGLRGEADVERARSNARAFGWEPVTGDHVLEHDGYLAGSDERRAADLNAPLADPSIDGVWCIRGGYGVMRLLPALDFAALSRNPKPIIGFSDITALHCAVQRRCSLVSYHGPVARAELTEFSRRSLTLAVVERLDSGGTAAGARTLRGGRASGILAGGNLAVLTALVGTPYAADLKDAILVLEDIDERTYRVDRMLRQLYLAGLLQDCRAIVFGECTNCSEQAESGSRRLDEVLVEMADLIGVPCVAGVPIGHIPDQWTLPLGARAELDADSRKLTVIP